jgi:hypothetical protein
MIKMKNYCSFLTKKTFGFLLLCVSCMSFQVAIAQGKTVSEEPSGKYDEQIQQNINEQLLSKILILEKEIKSQLEKQNKKFHSITQFYTGSELEKIRVLLPHFTSKSYVICDKDMLLDISKSQPNETIIYIDILSSALYKINIKK